MYLEYWGLSDKPFENTPDPRFLYPSEEHREGLDRLLYAVSGEKGCAMLSGEYGCGKTILVRTLISRLDLERYELALINYPIFDRENFLRELSHQFGQSVTGRTRVEWFRELSSFFYENLATGKNNVLVIDEAQIIEDPRVYEELRLLLNIQLEDRFLINVLLVGQPELRERIMLHPQLDQRIAVKFHLHRFDQPDSEGYVRHRLAVAGAQREVFTQEALYLIYRMTNGVPRRINNLADLCLLEGANKKAPKVTEEIIKYVL
ncbi:MAG TPA: AAA family ATPase [Acidobacteriota bacterium]|nr:AAA family ATPase [Acidobacteriota bacterium]